LSPNYRLDSRKTVRTAGDLADTERLTSPKQFQKCSYANQLRVYGYSKFHWHHHSNNHNWTLNSYVAQTRNKYDSKIFSLCKQWGIWEHGGIVPLILGLGGTPRWAFIFRHRPLYARRKPSLTKE
jgi:hypothetical protein